MKKLCNRYQLRYPPWLDGNDLTVKQYKMRVRWFIEDFMLQQAQHAQPPQSPDGDGLGKASTPPNSPRDGKPQSGVSTPTGAGSPIGSDDDSSSSSSESSGRPPSAAAGRPCEPEPAAGAAGDPPSSAAVIGHMMDNLLDNMEVLHPGVREEVQQTICAPHEEGWPAEGPAIPSPSLGTAGPARDPREVKSEPPQSPRPMDCEAEPAASTVEIPCVEPAEPNPGAPEPVETATVATPGSWPAQGQTESMDGSWNVLSDIATEESVEMED